MSRVALAALVLSAHAASGAAPPVPLALEIADYLALPITGKLEGTGHDRRHARANQRASATSQGRRGRTFLVDLNGPVYILDKASKRLTTYLDFNGRGRQGLFRKLAYEVGFGNGVVTLQFDPDYSKNGKFYTVHIEDPALEAPAVPDSTDVPGLDLAGYAPTAGDCDAGPNRARRRVDRMDRHQSLEHAVRRPRARTAARRAQHAYSSAR